MNGSASSIARVPLSELKIARVIALEWQDGPMQGFVQLSAPPSYWRFQLIAERFDSEALDSRLYLLSEVPLNLWEDLVESLHSLGDPNRLVWVPDWRFETDRERDFADSVVARLTEVSLRGAKVIMRSSNMTSVDEIWQLHGHVRVAM